MGNNGCTICLPNLINDIRKLSQNWNERLLNHDEGDDSGSDEDDSDDDDPDDGDSTSLLKPAESSKDFTYFKSQLFKEYVVNKSSRMKEIIAKSKQVHEE